MQTLNPDSAKNLRMCWTFSIFWRLPLFSKALKLFAFWWFVALLCLTINKPPNLTGDAVVLYMCCTPELSKTFTMKLEFHWSYFSDETSAGYTITCLFHYYLVLCSPTCIFYSSVVTYHNHGYELFGSGLPLTICWNSAVCNGVLIFHWCPFGMNVRQTKKQ